MFGRECESIRPLISAFFDGDLTPSESTILHKHLAECTECRAVVDEYQRIRSDLRDLPQASPPDNLANSVWMETVERPRPTGVRRIFSATTAKVGLSTVAALAILAVISAFLVVRGYNQGLTPAIASSEPTTSQTWPVYQPVKIVFNKPMNHKSVEENLQVWPPGERDRIPTSWQGNTLVLGSSSSQSTLFLPGTNYQVMVLGTAQDAYGHQIGRTWSISFTTSTVTNTAQSQTPTPAETPSPQPTGQPTRDPAIAAVTPTATAQSNGSAQSTATAGNTGSGQGSTGQPTPTAPPSTPSSNPGASPTPTAAATKTATATSTSSATSTATSQPTSTPTASPATPTVASTPTVTPATPAATPEASPTETQVASAGSPTPEILPVTGAFGSVYWANQDVQTKLGAPSDIEAAMNASELGFQRGTMYERYDTGEIYVFFSSGQWTPSQDSWTQSDGEGGGAGPDAGLWIPKQAFWKVWSADSGLSDSIGYAVEQDAHLMGGSVQPFAHGIMLYSDQGFVYVVYDDGTWALYPDTSGHGDLLTPTPVPDSTATPTVATPTETAVSSATQPTETPSTTTNTTLP